MARIIFAVFAILVAGSFAEAQERFDPSRFTEVDKKLLDAAQASMEAHPSLYHYVCVNAFSQQVLRSSRRPLARPGGRHPDRPAATPDIVLGSFGGPPSAAAVERLKELCAQHNAAAGGGGAAGAAGRPAAKSVPRPVLPVLAAEVTPQGERFSNHARRLLEITSADFALNGKPAHAPTSKEQTLEDARFIASLTQSKNQELQRAALGTCLLYLVHRGPDADLELVADVAKWSLDTGAIDLGKELKQLLKDREVQPKDGEGGILDETLGQFGQALAAIAFTREFREHRLQQVRTLAAAGLSALTRQQMVSYADSANVGQLSPRHSIRVTLVHVKNDRIYLQIANQTGKPQRNVMIATRGIADPPYVRRAANGHRLQLKVAGAFDFFGLPDAAVAEMPAMVDVWEATQMLDVGAILYVPEWPAAANIRVALCSIDRLKMTEHVRVSMWSDELVAKDVAAWNLTKVLNEVRPASERIDKEAVEANRKKTEGMQADLAKLALNLAKDAIARGDETRTRAFLQQAINISPNSPAGKEAQQLLKRYQP